MSNRPISAPWFEAHDLGHAEGGQVVLRGLTFRIGPGLTLVRGGEQRGKTTLLRLLAGELQPSQGTLQRHAAQVFRADRAEPEHAERTIAQAWAQHGRRWPQWDDALAHDLADAFGLTEHLHKHPHMLSTGSRRKAACVVAFASGADVALLDVPHASLDASSSRVLTELLAEAAQHPRRAWVVTDYEPLPGIADSAYAGVIDLGD
ncbi:MAG: ABC transporter ATP-binding protein [Burkholderiaceae bacterium]